MYHLVVKLRPHRAMGHPDLMHGYPVDDLAEAVTLAKQLQRDNYADPHEFQNEDRSINLDTAALTAEVSK